MPPNNPDETPPAYRHAPPLLTRQPYKTLWTLTHLATLPLRTPFWILYSLPRRNRQNPTWSWWQASIVHLIKLHFEFLTTLRPRPNTSISPGGTNGPRERFELIPPIAADKLVGVAAEAETSVRAEARPGSWYLRKFDPRTNIGSGGKKTKVVLYFCGGAYVVGAPFSPAYKATLDTLLPAIGPDTLLFACGYRLASVQGNHHPAQLIDALSAFVHLQTLGISASDIILLGNSAGGHLCLSLLRYLTSHPSLNLGLPSAVLLSSAWLNLSIPISTYTSHPSYHRDGLPGNILQWGLDAFVPGNVRLTDPYISPGLHAFRTTVPIFVGVADGEVMLEENVRFAEAMGELGSDVELWVSKDDGHDTFMHMSFSGFAACTRRYIGAMREFLVGRGWGGVGEEVEMG